MKKAFIITTLIVISTAICFAQYDTIKTVAGTGVAGFSGDGAPALNAKLNNPIAVGFDASGNMYISDLNNSRIRKVDINGIITTIAGTGTSGYNGDEIAATSAQLHYPQGIGVDSAGNVFVADALNYRIRKISTSGIITTVAGTGSFGYSGDGGLATLANVNAPNDVTVDSHGNIYISDEGNKVIRKVNTLGIISTIAGTGSAGFSGDNGLATLAQLSSPKRISLDRNGNLYIADAGNHRIRMIDTLGIIKTIAGNGTAGISGDGGSSTAAQLQYPAEVVVDASGNIYIDDQFGNNVRMVNTSGIISTIAGTGIAGYSGDGGLATLAQLNQPTGIDLDAFGNIYVADWPNNRIRRINKSCHAPTIGEAAISANGSTTICNGGSVVLSVTASGFYYQWNKNGVEIQGQTNQSLFVSAAGSYTCSVSDSCGITTSNSIAVIQNFPPTSAQAKISAGGPTTFCSGSNVILTVSASGFNYQWKKNGSNISGATNQNYTASVPGTFKCVSSNSCGSKNSNEILVAVTNGPTSLDAAITANGAVSICNGSTVVLTVASPGFSYQWKLDASDISGSTNQNLTVSTPGSYNCQVSNSCGSILSNTIVVSVTFPPSAADANISAGGSTTICNGDVVELTVATSGLTYQWKKGNNIISGATQQHFSASKAASYKCDVSNACGVTTSNSISVSVNQKPTVSISQSDCSGGTVLLTCISDPPTGVTFQWKKGNSILSGATNPTYSASQNGNYKCVVTNTLTGCSKTSNTSSVAISCKEEAQINNQTLEVFPNPSADYFTINIPESQSLYGDLYIYDITGKLVESDMRVNEPIQVGNSLTSGVYFLKIILSDGSVDVVKLVKNL